MTQVHILVGGAGNDEMDGDRVTTEQAFAPYPEVGLLGAKSCRLPGLEKVPPRLTEAAVVGGWVGVCTLVDCRLRHLAQ